jgi:hypothetical protein
MQVVYYYKHKAVYQADHNNHPIPQVGEYVVTQAFHAVVHNVVHDHFRDMIAIALEACNPPKAPESWGRKPE